MKKAYPIPRTRPQDVSVSQELNIEGQGNIPYPQMEEVATPKVSKGQPSAKMQVRGRGAMLRGTTYTVR